MHKLRPFRQYDEQDVINLFALANSDVLESTTGVGSGDNGVFVKVSDGNFNQDVEEFSDCENRCYVNDVMPGLA